MYYYEWFNFDKNCYVYTLSLPADMLMDHAVYIVDLAIDECLSYQDVIQSPVQIKTAFRCKVELSLPIKHPTY